MIIIFKVTDNVFQQSNLHENHRLMVWYRIVVEDALALKPLQGGS